MKSWGWILNWDCQDLGLKLGLERVWVGTKFRLERVGVGVVGKLALGKIMVGVECYSCGELGLGIGS